MIFAYNFRKRFRTLLLQTILVICCCMSVSHAVFVHWLHAFSSHVILTHCSHLQFPRSLRTWSKCQNSVLDYTAHPCVKLALCNPRGHFGICFRCTWIRCQNSLSDYAAPGTNAKMFSNITTEKSPNGPARLAIARFTLFICVPFFYYFSLFLFFCSFVLFAYLSLLFFCSFGSILLYIVSSYCIIVFLRLSEPSKRRFREEVTFQMQCNLLPEPAPKETPKSIKTCFQTKAFFGSHFRASDL